MDIEKRSFNTTHPELEEGEMFLTNVLIGASPVYAGIEWATKRKGNAAYTIEGANLDAYVPVFIQRKEYGEGIKSMSEKEESRTGLNKTVVIVKSGERKNGIRNTTS